ncbi:MAG: hypothetical protein JWR10_2902 [Rubritepida sp.]|nr:hypothetical protein [Rubritepida sp.]
MRPCFFAGLLILSACAELTRPLPPEPPTELAGALLAQPLPVILDLAAADFDRGGAGLDGHPAEMALALARLEWLGGEARPGGRLTGVPQSFLFGLQRAVEEGRQSLAITPNAAPELVVPALLTAARSLRRGDTATAGAALTGPAFRVTDRPALNRLREPGPFPDASLAVPALRDEVARRGYEGQIERRLSENLGSGVTTFGFGGTTDR